MSPAKFDKCVKQIKLKIKKGQIPKTYKKGKKRLRSNAYAICSRSR